MTIYRVTEGYPRDEATRLSDAEEQIYTNPNGYSLSFVPVTIDEVTVDELLCAVEREMEGANHHSEMEIVNWLPQMLYKHLSPEKVKEIIWDICNTKGFLWV